MKIIGHRGARGLAPENTIASLKKALELGVDRIEFDVRVTIDHIPVIFHDETLIDHSGDKLPLNRTTYQELKNHKPGLASLQEVLDFIKGRVPLYIEVKMGSDCGPIVRELKKYQGDYWLGSKSQRTLLELHRQLPKVPKVVIESWSGVRARYRAKQLDTRILSMYQRFLWSGFIVAVHRGGYELY